MRLHVLNLAGQYARVCQGLANHRFLRGTIRRRQPVTTTIMVDRTSPDHREDRVPRSSRVGETLEDDDPTALSAAGADPRAVDEVRVRFLGRKGELTKLMKGLGTLPADERRETGRLINVLKRKTQDRVDAAVGAAEAAERQRDVQTRRVDVSLPARTPWLGSLHPVTRTRRALERIFRGK